MKINLSEIMKNGIIKTMNRVSSEVWESHTEYAVFYTAYVDEDPKFGSFLVKKPLSCIPLSHFDERYEDDEIIEMTKSDLISAAMDFARKRFGAKFEGDMLACGSRVSDFANPGSSANCIMHIERVPFVNTQLKNMLHYSPPSE
jgi:hypothetical protein